jgi:hypothetical protein
LNTSAVIPSARGPAQAVYVVCAKQMLQEETRAKMIGCIIFDKMALIESFIKTRFPRVGWLQATIHLLKKGFTSESHRRLA